MHIIDDNEGEERLSHLISAAREEKLLVSTDDVAKALSVGAAASVTATLVKPVLSIVHKAIIAVLATGVTVSTVYYYNYSKKKSSHTTNPTTQTTNQKQVIETTKPAEIIQEKTESQITSPANSATEINTEPAKSEKEKQEKNKERNYFDGNATVVFDFDNKHVQMVAADEVQSLVIDNINIDKADFNKYSNVINYGLELKKEQDKKRVSNTSDKAQTNKIIMQSLLDELSNLKLINENESFDFYLKGEKATLNGTDLSIENFTALKNKYEQVSGKTLPAVANIHIKH